MNKVFMICVLYSDNIPGTRMTIAPILKKNGATVTDTRHMFFDKGIIEAFAGDNVNASTRDELEEICTEHAIECGAEELEILDVASKHLTVSNSCNLWV